MKETIHLFSDLEKTYFVKNILNDYDIIDHSIDQQKIKKFNTENILLLINTTNTINYLKLFLQKKIL